jgi:predicted DNA-binding WGR domain protein
MLLSRSSFRFDNPDGSSKDWIIELYDDGTVIRKYGSTGKTMRSSTAPASVTAPSARKWYDRKIREKVEKGYYPINVCQADQDAIDSLIAEEKSKEATAREKELLGQISYDDFVLI